MPSIWEESPYYREFKGKVLKNAERLGRVIRLAALRVLMSGFTERYWRVSLLLRKGRTKRIQSHSAKEHIERQVTTVGFLPWSSWFRLSAPCARGLPAASSWSPGVSVGTISAALGLNLRGFSQRFSTDQSLKLVPGSRGREHHCVMAWFAESLLLRLAVLVVSRVFL